MTEIQNAYGSVDWAILKNIFKIIRLALLGNKTYYEATVFKIVRFGFNNRQIREIKQREFINTLNTCSYLIYDRWHSAQWGKGHLCYEACWGPIVCPHGKTINLLQYIKISLFKL